MAGSAFTRTPVTHDDDAADSPGPDRSATVHDDGSVDWRRPSPSPTPPLSVRVFPLVDVNLGTVDFQADGIWRRFWTDDPHRLIRAMSCAVRPARWNPERGELVVTVAATGLRNGREVVFASSH